MTFALEQFLDFATDAARQAGELTLKHYQRGVAVERKADRTVVTIADREAEQLLRALIEQRFPDHAIVGEEFGSDTRDSNHRWIIDPIDGTNSFVRGVRFTVVLIGLEVGGDAVVGVAFFPAIDEMLSAAHGLGARWNDRPARVSSVTSLGEACVTYTDMRGVTERLGDGWSGLQGDSALQRGWGDCYGHCLVATGRSDVMLDPRMNPWDCAASFQSCRKPVGSSRIGRVTSPSTVATPSAPMAACTTRSSRA